MATAEEKKMCNHCHTLNKGTSAMCINYQTVKAETLIEAFTTPIFDSPEWPEQVWQDYLAPIITGDGTIRQALVGTYGMVPKRKIPEGVKKYTTMNARIEDVGARRSYSKAWREGQLCLVPLMAFYEPNWETGKHIRYRIGMADESPFAVAGLWREWKEADGTTSQSFTQLTMNADDHPVMKHFHRPGDEKRSLIIIPQDEWDEWLMCRDPERARTFARPYPAGLMVADPWPLTNDGRM